MSTFRSDLHGFRGFSVILVFLCSIWPNVFKNGFTGVDIFFVLSGYLSQMRYSEKTTTMSGVMIYYRNRFLRLFPMYLGALFVITAIGSVILPEKLTEDLLNDAKWAVFAATNLEGYFTNRGFFMQDYSFLHHTWILALQTQYFLVLPLISLQLARCKSIESKLAFSFLITVISLLIHLFTIGPSSTELVFSRLWQFQIGAISFLVTPSRGLLEDEKKNDVWAFQEDELVGKKWREEVRTAYVLISLILASITVIPDSLMLLKSDTLIRLSTTVLVAILFAFGPSVSGSKVENLFGNKILVFLGQNSFAMYLIHWPILEAFCCLHGIAYLSAYQAIQVAFLVSIIAISLSVFIEKRLQSNKIFSVALTVLSFALTTMLIIGKSSQSSFHIAYYNSAEALTAAPPKAEFYWSARETFFDPNWSYNSIVANAIRKNGDWCFWPTADRNLPNCVDVEGYDGHCRITNGPGTISVVMIGDGFPAAYETVKSVFGQIDVFYTYDCDILSQTPEEDYCSALQQTILSNVTVIKPDLIFLFNNHNPSNLANLKSDTVTQNLRKLSETAKHIILNVELEENAENVAEVLYYSLQRNTRFRLEYSNKEAASGQETLKLIKEKCPNCVVFDVQAQFCDGNGKCSLLDRSTLLGYHADKRRLSYKGQEVIYPSLRDLVDGVLKDKS